MVSVGNYTWDDEKTREELLENVEIEKTTFDDTLQVIEIMVKCFGVGSPIEAYNQLYNSRANLNESVKLVDKRDGKIYGLLIFSEFKIDQGSPINFFRELAPINDYLRLCDQVNGFAFVIDKRLRGMKYDKKMLFFNMDYLNNYRFIWCGVDNTLHSHHYWERLGFYKLFEIEDATFYLMKPSKNDMNDIFILKALSESYNEKNNIKRREREMASTTADEREYQWGF